MTTITVSRNILIICTLFLITAQCKNPTITHQCDRTSPCGCSINPVILAKIVGGEVVEKATWSWIVSISLAEKFFCGGTIISDKWILTAAHCVERIRAHYITIYAGSITRWSGTQQRQAFRKVIHPDYNPSLFTNDIALLELEHPLDLDEENIKPICLDFVDSKVSKEREWPPINSSVVAIGWGRLSEDGPASELLQQVTLKTVDQHSSTCSSIVADSQVQFCADASHENKDACQGDSGGPLMMFTPQRRWILVGITSYGYGCARSEYSGVYTRIAAYESWINQITDGSYFHSTSSSTHSRPMPLLLLHFLVLLFNMLTLVQSKRQAQ